MENITWYGHASFSFIDKVSGQRIYYVDPFSLPKNRLRQPADGGLEKADIVFITHAHYDHLSPQDINLILKPETIVVATPDSLETLNIAQEKLPVEPNKSYDIKGFKFETVPAYNVVPERLKFHPRSNNWVGYIFSLNGLKIYHAGDTDYIPEMDSFKNLNLDIAMLPIGGTYVMTPEEAVVAANAIGAKTTIPMHYKGLLKEKTAEGEEIFKKGVTNSEVIILEELR